VQVVNAGGEKISHWPWAQVGHPVKHTAGKMGETASPQTEIGVISSIPILSFSGPVFMWRPAKFIPAILGMLWIVLFLGKCMVYFERQIK